MTAFLVAILCAVTAAAITTRPTALPATVKLRLLSAPDAAADADLQTVHEPRPSFAARYWHQQRDFGTGPSVATYGDGDDAAALQQPPHKLSAAQQEHILDDIRRHNRPQLWPESTTAATAGKWPLQDAAGDQLQELLRINGATAADDEDAPPATSAAVPAGDGAARHGRQRSAAADAGWTPQQLPPQYYDDQHGPRQSPAASPSPYFTPPSDPLSHHQFYPSVQHYPQHRPQNLVTTPSSSSSSSSSLSTAPADDGDELEDRIRQQLTELAAGSAGVNNYNRTDSGGDGRLQQQPASAGSASGDHAQYVRAAAADKNAAVVKTVVVRQKPSVVTPAAAIPDSEQQRLEQLARQVLPPGVAQYEIIKAAGGVDGGLDDAVTAADSAAPVQQRPSPGGGKKKPVTFVILEERPDGTVRVRGVEKKRADGEGPGPVDIEASADDEQLQKLVDKLNRGELRLPSAPSKAAADDVGAASAAAQPPPPPIAVKSRRPPPPYHSQTSAAQKTTSAPDQHRFQTIFLPTVLPTESVASTVAATADEATVGTTQNRYHHHHHHLDEQQQQKNHQQKQQQYYTPAATAATPANVSAPSVHGGNKAAREGTFSGALRRRGYYAMAKYMRQAGIDAVLEDTGPFTIFVPTDKAFRALLVQLGGPDRAEDKFRENPRLLIGLLLHHVVPGAFKAADLKAGDEMTGVSLAGTQLRANLYARQLFDNRWNDIEVLTVNGARVLDDAVSPAAAATDDGFSFLDDGAAVGPVQQRRDMVLSSADGRAQHEAEGSAAGQPNGDGVVAIGHAVDRVLFPLPVGDVLATMRADRQRRYSVFLRAIDEHCSASVRSLLSGSRTMTVFAPLDEAFRSRRGSGNHSRGGSVADGVFRDEAVGGGGGGGRVAGKRERRRAAADRFVLSHVVMAGPGDPPMYTAGLRFYQVRDTAYRLPVGGGQEEEYDDDGTDDGIGGSSLVASPTSVDGDDAPRYYQLTVYKDSGRIRLNGGAAQVSVRNVPATNGVLHGIDAPLV